MSAPSTGPSPKGGLRQMTRALRHRNYQLFFFGQGTSLIGTWVQRIALSWLVYRLTGSALLLGVVGFSSQILTFLGAPLAGVLADRLDRRPLLLATQALAMTQAFLLAVLTLTGTVAVWHIIVLGLLLGLVNAFDIPIRQSFVVEMLESREDLPNAIALNSFLVNGARLIGPAMAGVVIAWVGEGTCFLINGLSFLAVIAALAMMKVAPHPRQVHKGNMLADLKEGVAYVYHFAPIRAILLLLAVISLLGMPYIVLMPVFADEVLHGGPGTLGVLMGATGVGAIMGALFLASRPSIRGLGRLIAIAAGLFGAGLIAFSFSHVLWLSLALLVIVGFGGMVQMASSNTLIQTIVDDDKRGRVMSLYTMSFMGMGPFGALLAGWLASLFGAPMALVLGGAGCMLMAGIFASQLPRLRRGLHPVYVRLQIIPAPSPQPSEKAL